jgi:hypothetical protein
MVSVEGKRFIWQSQLIFFPDLTETEEAVQRLGSTNIIRLWQTQTEIPEASFVIEKHPFQTSWIDLTKSLDSLFRDMSRTSRNEIHQAEKKFNGRVTVHVNPGSDYQRGFLSLYNRLAENKNQPLLSHRRLSEYLAVADLWVLSLDDQVRCGHVLLHDSQLRRVRLMFSASTRLNAYDDTHVSSALNRYLHWQEMQRYKAQGIRVFDFGGIGSKSDATSAIARFKLSLGGHPVQQNNYVIGAPSAAVVYRLYKAYRNTDAHFRALFGRLHNMGF